MDFYYRSQANKYTPEELMLMKTQDIGYIFQKVQSEKKVINTYIMKLWATNWFFEINMLVIIMSLINLENWKVNCDAALSW